MKQHILSHLAARNAPPGRYADGAGLWPHKRERAHGKWVLRYFLHGKRRKMDLGRWPDVSIADARTAAFDARAMLRSGQYPIEKRRQARRIIHRLTVKEAIDSCFEARKAQLSPVLRRPIMRPRRLQPIGQIFLRHLAIELVDAPFIALGRIAQEMLALSIEHELERIGHDDFPSIPK